MPGLIHANFAAARKGYLREQAISLILDWIAGDLVTYHLGDKRIHVVAHQVELVNVILLRGMHGNLCWRQSENQPSVADVHICELKHVAQKGAVSLRVRAIDD